MLQAKADMTFDRLSLRYRLRTHDVVNGWRVIEQQAYGDVQDGRLVDVWLLCSGFRPDAPGAAAQAPVIQGAFCDTRAEEGDLSGRDNQ